MTIPARSARKKHGAWALLLWAACGTPHRDPPAVEASASALRPPRAAPSAPAQATGIVELNLRALDPSHPRPDDAPAALAFVPEDFDRALPYTLVVFLHGWNGCVRVLLMEGEVGCTDARPPRAAWGLGQRLSASQRVVLAPQLAFRQRSGRPGRFSDPAYTRRWLEAAYEELALPSASRVVLMAHSAGFETALVWTALEEVHTVLLMDALYARAPAFADWLAREPEHTLVSLSTGGSTGRQQRRLSRLAERHGTSEQLIARRTRARHADVPYEEGPALLAELAIRRGLSTEADAHEPVEP